MIEQDDYQWLFRRSPTMATSIAEGGEYLDVNDAMLEKLGFTREEMVGRHPEDFATVESADRIRNELRPALRRTGKLENKPISFLSKDGEVIDCVTNALIEYDQEGRFLRTVAMYQEISEAARSNFKYRALYRSIRRRCCIPWTGTARSSP